MAAKRMVGVAEPASNAGDATARRIRLRGHVQGVGFRPFVYRLALEHGIVGHVQNQLGEVQVLAIGAVDSVDAFMHDLIERFSYLDQFFAVPVPLCQFHES